jgi:hypothetical protein
LGRTKKKPSIWRPFARFVGGNSFFKKGKFREKTACGLRRGGKNTPGLIRDSKGLLCGCLRAEKRRASGSPWQQIKRNGESHFSNSRSLQPATLQQSHFPTKAFETKAPSQPSLPKDKGKSPEYQAHDIPPPGYITGVHRVPFRPPRTDKPRTLEADFPLIEPLRAPRALRHKAIAAGGCALV